LGGVFGGDLDLLPDKALTIDLAVDSNLDPGPSSEAMTKPTSRRKLLSKT
jgi:hypothetical protein